MKRTLRYVRMTAIALSTMLAILTFLNILTVATHSIEFELPDQDDFSWSVDPVGQRLVFLGNFTVRNSGAFDITGLDIKAWVETSEGARLIEFDEDDLAIIRGSQRTFRVIVFMKADAMEPYDWFRLMTRDDTLNLTVDIDADYMFGMVHVTVDEVLQYPWMSPVELAMANGNASGALDSLKRIAEAGKELAIDILEPAAIELLAGLETMSIPLAGGAEFVMEVFNVSEFSRQINCSIQKELDDGLAGMTVSIFADYSDGKLTSELKGVELYYVG